MLHSFKIGTKQLVLDTNSAVVYTLTELEKRIFDGTHGLIDETCPSALRYELAKYDSTMIDAAYAHVYKIRTGVQDIGQKLTFDTDTANSANECELVKYSSSSPHFANAVIALADAGKERISILSNDADKIESGTIAPEYEKLAREIYTRARTGKRFIFVPFELNKCDIENFDSLSDSDKHRVECALFSKI